MTLPSTCGNLKKKKKINKMFLRFLISTKAAERIVMWGGRRASIIRSVSSSLIVHPNSCGGGRETGTISPPVHRDNNF